jgi:hypothetical protein
VAGIVSFFDEEKEVEDEGLKAFIQCAKALLGLGCVGRSVRARAPWKQRATCAVAKVVPQLEIRAALSHVNSGVHGKSKLCTGLKATIGCTCLVLKVTKSQNGN